MDPAMLVFLDGANNVASHPNENYARELMEIFTLGVDNYSEDDVRESARAWTGWRVARQHRNGRFDPRLHDDGRKTFLGPRGQLRRRRYRQHHLRSAAMRAILRGKPAQLVRVQRPGARARGRRRARASRATTSSWRRCSRTILAATSFTAERAYRALVKSPAEFVIGTYKALGLPRSIRWRSKPSRRWASGCSFRPTSPAGRADKTG